MRTRGSGGGGQPTISDAGYGDERQSGGEGLEVRVKLEVSSSDQEDQDQALDAKLQQSIGDAEDSCQSGDEGFEVRVKLEASSSDEEDQDQDEGLIAITQDQTCSKNISGAALDAKRRKARSERDRRRRQELKEKDPLADLEAKKKKAERERRRRQELKQKDPCTALEAKQKEAERMRKKKAERERRRRQELKEKDPLADLEARKKRAEAVRRRRQELKQKDPCAALALEAKQKEAERMRKKKAERERRRRQELKEKDPLAALEARKKRAEAVRRRRQELKEKDPLADLEARKKKAERDRRWWEELQQKDPVAALEAKRKQAERKRKRRHALKQKDAWTASEAKVKDAERKRKRRQEVQQGISDAEDGDRCQSSDERFAVRANVGVCTSGEKDQDEGDFLNSLIAPSCFVCRADAGNEIGLNSLPSSGHYSFFMDELLEIPINETKTYLKRLEEPGKWIKLCESCQLLVVKGKAVSQQINKLQCQLRQFKKTILENMKGTLNILTSTSVTQGESTEFLKEHGALRMIQTFVSSKTYWGLDVEGETCQPTIPSNKSFSDEQKCPPSSSHSVQKSLDKVSIVKAPSISDSDQDDFSEANSPLGYTDQDLDPLDITESIQVETDVSAKSQSVHGHQKDTPTRRCPSPIPPASSSSVGKLNTTSIHGQKCSPDLSEKEVSRTRTRSKSKLEKSISHTKRSSLDLELPLNQHQLIGSQSKTLYKRSVYDCPNCPHIKNYSVLDYALHLDIHLRMPYQCSKCLELFLAEADLCEHWKEKHAGTEAAPTLEAETFTKTKFDPGQIWKCEYCYQGFSTDMERTEHEIDCCDCSGDPPVRRKRSLSYSCTFCQANLRNFPEWRLHRTIHHPEMDRMCCYYCDKSFSETTEEGVEARHEQNMKDHMVSKHKRNEFGIGIKILEECSSCGIVFASQIEFQKHFLEKHGIPERESYRCKICGRGYSRPTYFRRHMTLHHFHSEASICDVCGFKCEKKEQLANHKMLEHGVDPVPDGFKILTCPNENCSYKTVQRHKLRAHVMVHDEKTLRFCCSVCGKRFNYLQVLINHEELHRNKQSKPHACELCGKRFATRHYLNTHKRLSHEKRAFPCQIRMKALRAQGMLVTGSSTSKKARTRNAQNDLEVGGEVQDHVEVLISGDSPFQEDTSEGADSI